MNNVEIVKQGYQFFAEGNIEAVLNLFNPEIVWDECTGFPYVSDDGIYVGPNDIVQVVFAKIPEYFEGFQVEIGCSGAYFWWAYSGVSHLGDYPLRRRANLT